MSCTPQEFHSISFEFKWIVVRYSYNYNRISRPYDHKNVIYYFYLLYLNFIWAFLFSTSYSIKLAGETPAKHTTIHLNRTPRASSACYASLVHITFYMHIHMYTHTCVCARAYTHTCHKLWKWNENMIAFGMTVWLYLERVSSIRTAGYPRLWCPFVHSVSSANFSLSRSQIGIVAAMGIGHSHTHQCMC